MTLEGDIQKAILDLILKTNNLKGNIMSWKEDDEKAYTTYDDIVGRSFRRGTRKAIKFLTLGLITGEDPIKGIAKDAAGELITKVIPRSMDNDD